MYHFSEQMISVRPEIFNFVFSYFPYFSHSSLLFHLFYKLSVLLHSNLLHILTICLSDWRLFSLISVILCSILVLYSCLLSSSPWQSHLFFASQKAEDKTFILFCFPCFYLKNTFNKWTNQWVHVMKICFYSPPWNWLSLL